MSVGDCLLFGSACLTSARVEISGFSGVCGATKQIFLQLDYAEYLFLIINISVVRYFKENKIKMGGSDFISADSL